MSATVTPASKKQMRLSQAEEMLVKILRAYEIAPQEVLKVFGLAQQPVITKMAQ